MVAGIGPCDCPVFSLQELSEGGFFFLVLLRRGIEPLHLVELFRRQLREVANEVNRFPTILVLRRGAFSPGRQGGEANTVVDHPEDLTVRH